jgi:GTP-binding protein
MTKNIRNIAIIAHVDHGKTTLVDGLLKQTKTFDDHQTEMQQELIMDSMDQERERGITITAKITAVQHEDYRINIIDTPGHADFGGEVERTLHMADGCLLVVDAQEGPMPQTKFVLKKAFAAGLRPIVVINKIDKPGSRIAQVEDELSNLFLDLATDDNQLHYPTFYAIAREGKAWSELPDDPTQPADLEPIFKAIVDEFPSPAIAEGEGAQMLVTALDWDSFQGKYSIGKLQRGNLAKGDPVVLCNPEGVISSGKIDRIYAYRGLARYEVDKAEAGEIICVTGMSGAHIGETIASSDKPEALPTIELEPPTLKMYLGPNTSPFKGKEGKFTTGRQIGERLEKELETNIGLKVENSSIGFLVSGRGELHLSVLVESMRREGYEFEVGRPQVVTIVENGKTLEPYEETTVEVPTEHAGVIQSEFGKRRAELREQIPTEDGGTKFVYEMPTRALLGLRAILVTATKGTLVMDSLMSGYKPIGAAIEQQRNGALIAWEAGTSTPYALQNAETRGICFIGPGEKVYGGQVVGLNSRRDDMDLNVTKEKHLTNMRSKSSDGTVQLTPPTRLSLEQCIDILEDDELLEVTPESLRLRKRALDRSDRKKKN